MYCIQILIIYLLLSVIPWKIHFVYSKFRYTRRFISKSSIYRYYLAYNETNTLSALNVVTFYVSHSQNIYCILKSVVFKVGQFLTCPSPTYLYAFNSSRAGRPCSPSSQAFHCFLNSLRCVSSSHPDFSKPHRPHHRNWVCVVESRILPTITLMLPEQTLRRGSV